MPYYESVFIARQDISGTQVDSLTESLTNIIQEGGGQVTKKEFWGLRNLAYKIKKNRKGHFVLLNIDGPSDAVLEMERNMRINEDVIRYLTVRVDELEAEESIMLRSRGSRDSGRGGRRGGFDRGGFDRGGRDRGGHDRGDRGGHDRGDRGGPRKPEAASGGADTKAGDAKAGDAKAGDGAKSGTDKPDESAKSDKSGDKGAEQ
jgi:small subunit ribosomal protein S6